MTNKMTTTKVFNLIAAGKRAKKVVEKRAKKAKGKRVIKAKGKRAKRAAGKRAIKAKKNPSTKAGISCKTRKRNELRKMRSYLKVKQKAFYKNSKILK